MHSEFTPDEPLEERLSTDTPTTLVGRLSKKVWSQATDRYNHAQFAANMVTRIPRLGLSYYVFTNSDAGFMTNLAELGLITAISIPIYEAITTPVHYLIRPEKGSVKEFLTKRWKTELQHYKAKGAATTTSNIATASLETALGVPRIVSTQIGGAPLGILQFFYASDVRRRVDAGEALDKLRDKIVNLPYNIASAAGRNLRQLAQTVITTTP